MRTVPVFVLAAGIVAVVAITLLQDRSDRSRRAQVALAQVGSDLNELQWAPFSVVLGMQPQAIRIRMQALERRIDDDVARASADEPVPALDGVDKRLQASFVAGDDNLRLMQLFSTAQGRAAMAAALTAPGAKGLPERVAAPLRTAQATDVALLRTFELAGRQYDARASRAKLQALLGSGAAIALLVLAFALVYGRARRARSEAERLAAENASLAAANRNEAVTDALTGLGNRRGLIDALTAELADPATPLALALFDLDGFKQYNDSFGHPSGDALLARLGERLTESLDGIGVAFRMGGDEFCVLARLADQEAAAVAGLAAAALSESGDAFSIGCSFGVALVPDEAASVEEALRLADQRMYAHKTSGRHSASRQSTDVLLQVLAERNAGRDHQVGDAADLAALTAEGLGVPEPEVKRIHLAAQLHDVGKSAIPETILDKPGPLDDEEREFMRRHTVIGARIVLAAPSLAHAAGLVRASHERYDGAGYPDGLRGEDIPLGARIVAVGDAFEAMIATRPYREAMSVADAVAELRRCAGTQFDPQVVEAFCGAVAAAATSRAA